MKKNGRPATTRLGREIAASGMTMQDVAWLTNIPVGRIRNAAAQKTTLTSDELERIRQAVTSHRVVYTRRLEPIHRITLVKATVGT